MCWPIFRNVHSAFLKGLLCAFQDHSKCSLHIRMPRSASAKVCYHLLFVSPSLFPHCKKSLFTIHQNIRLGSIAIMQRETACGTQFKNVHSISANRVFSISFIDEENHKHLKKALESSKVILIVH